MSKVIILTTIFITFCTASAAEITYVDFPKTKLVCIRTTDYTKMGEILGKVAGWAGPQGLMGPNTKFISVYYTNMFYIPETTPPVDVGINVSGDIKPGEGMTIVEIGGGKYAKYVHKGPYDQLKSAWRTVMDEIKNSKTYSNADKPSFEIYLNEPGKTKPEDLITEIYMPVEAK